MGSFSPVAGESKEPAFQDTFRRKHVCWSCPEGGGPGTRDRLSPQALLVALYTSILAPSMRDMTAELLRMFLCSGMNVPKQRNTALNLFRQVGEDSKQYWEQDIFP